MSSAKPRYFVRVYGRTVTRKLRVIETIAALGERAAITAASAASMSHVGAMAFAVKQDHDGRDVLFELRRFGKVEPALS